VGQYGTLFGGPGAAGGGASTAGASANTAPAITNAAGKLEAWNPQTMSGITPDKPAVQHTDFQTAGMDAGTGLPSYMTNWLSGGAVGPPPTLTQPGSTAAPVTQGAAEKGAAYVDKRKPGTGPPPAPPPTAKTTTPTTTPKTTAPTLSYVASQPNNYVVHDQYNSSQGVSSPVASPQGSSQPYWIDPKTGYRYADAEGKYPLNGMTGPLGPNQPKPSGPGYGLGYWGQV
jgi:hypothetical protein